MDNAILQIQNITGICVVRINSKKLYQHESARFRGEMIALLETGCQHLVLDLSEVRVMNSSAIGVVLLSADQVKKRGGELAVGGLNPLLKELFERMYLNTLFAIVETADQAVSLIQGHKKIPAT